MSKLYKLRAFKITCNSITDSEPVIVDDFISVMQNSIAQDRRMPLNSTDENGEEDLMCEFNIIQERQINGSMMRIAPSDNSVNLPDEVFEHEKILIKDLEKLNVNTNNIYKSHFYLAFNNNYLVTTLNLTTNIKRLQTYLNWLLRNVRGAKLYELTPMISAEKDLKGYEIKKIKIADTVINPYSGEEHQEETNFLRRVKNIPQQLVESLFKDTSTLHEAFDENMISAELLIKFSKPRKMKRDDYQRILGATMKPISDFDSLVVYPENGAPIKGEDIFNIKQVNVETIENGKISEENLYQEMEKFLIELQND
ncbi:hypothetical protein SAMN05421847_2168 [Halpernia humi]|uniref:Uncharacterized protein n=1 Tax=Halpernia humi TaxID=493375 RepID=A0A1H5ZUC7_9FLAO|nr:hypothetical protein [Halpernia humi]SEG39036.1 hypothetical protein SAMN05421847_2168 [Halpernia humi]